MSLLNWLRQRVGFLERRWLRDPDERAEHQALVRERLAPARDDPEDLMPADDQPDAPVHPTPG